MTGRRDARRLATAETRHEDLDPLAHRRGERGTEWARRAQELAAEAQNRAGDWIEKGRDRMEEQTQRLAAAFEAGREAMRDELRRGVEPERT